MKSKLITILLCVCLVACVFFAAWCNNTAELEQPVEDCSSSLPTLKSKTRSPKSSSPSCSKK